MMKYLCLGYHEEKAWQAIGEAERNALLEACRSYDQVLRERGCRLDGTALPRAESAMTLRFENGKVSVTAGPFADAREQLGGILILEAKDLNHAIQLMSHLPCMRLGGSLEIRPMDDERSA